MRAMVIDGYGDADRLRLDERPDPVPGPGELLVNVRAASVNPVDWKIRRGDLKLILHLGFPYIPGGDIAGEVAAVGPGVTPTVSHTFPLEQAAEAHRLSERSRTGSGPTPRPARTGRRGAPPQRTGARAG